MGIIGFLIRVALWVLGGIVALFGFGVGALFGAGTVEPSGGWGSWWEGLRRYFTREGLGEERSEIRSDDHTHPNR